MIYKQIYGKYELLATCFVSLISNLGKAPLEYQKLTFQLFEFVFRFFFQFFISLEQILRFTRVSSSFLS